MPRMDFGLFHLVFPFNYNYTQCVEMRTPGWVIVWLSPNLTRPPWFQFVFPGFSPVRVRNRPPKFSVRGIREGMSLRCWMTTSRTHRRTPSSYLPTNGFPDLARRFGERERSFGQVRVFWFSGEEFPGKVICGMSETVVPAQRGHVHLCSSLVMKGYTTQLKG